MYADGANDLANDHFLRIPAPEHGVPWIIGGALSQQAKSCTGMLALRDLLRQCNGTGSPWMPTCSKASGQPVTMGRWLWWTKLLTWSGPTSCTKHSWQLSQICEGRSKLRCLALSYSCDIAFATTGVTASSSTYNFEGSLIYNVRPLGTLH